MTRNRVLCPYHPLDGSEEVVRSRIELDIQGRQRAVRDERLTPTGYLPIGPPEQRIIMRYDYDLRGHRLCQISMEAGTRWMLPDALGKPIRAWDSRGHAFTTRHDALRRPIEHMVLGTTAASDPRTLGGPHVIERFEYGEAVPQAEALNLRTRAFRHSDSAGVITSARLDAAGTPTDAYDFKGNALFTTRQLLADATALPDWTVLSAETFESAARFDALNRTIQAIAPHHAQAATVDVTQHGFNLAGQLERVDVWLQRAGAPAGLLYPVAEPPSPAGVTRITYDAKGQRTSIAYDNKALTTYTYDPATFRLVNLATIRPKATFPKDAEQPPPAGWPGANVQNLIYTYDPVGNITAIRDDAQQGIFFRNLYIEPNTDYIYDATYRLIQAKGREHLGLAGKRHLPPTAPDARNAFHSRLPQPGDGNAMGTYTERYVYDAVGNFLQMQHSSSDQGNPGWTRCYAYAETSLIEDGGDGNPAKVSNRLSGTTLSATGAPSQADGYLYDLHGNMTRLPHLGGAAGTPNLHWDYRDRLIGADLGGGGSAAYAYDAGGERCESCGISRAAASRSASTSTASSCSAATLRRHSPTSIRRPSCWSARRCTSWTTSAALRWWRRGQPIPAASTRRRRS